MGMTPMAIEATMTNRRTSLNTNKLKVKSKPYNIKLPELNNSLNTIKVSCKNKTKRGNKFFSKKKVGFDKDKDEVLYSGTSYNLNSSFESPYNSNKKPFNMNMKQGYNNPINSI